MNKGYDWIEADVTLKYQKAWHEETACYMWLLITSSYPESVRKTISKSSPVAARHILYNASFCRKHCGLCLSLEYTSNLTYYICKHDLNQTFKKKIRGNLGHAEMPTG